MANETPRAIQRFLLRNTITTPASSITQNVQSSHGRITGGCQRPGAPGTKLVCGRVTVMFELAGLVPGVAELGDALQVAPGRFVKHVTAMAVLNEELAGSGVIVAV